MADEFILFDDSGLTTYVALYEPDGDVWNGSAFVTPSTGDEATYDIALTEVGTTGEYRGNMPSVASNTYTAVYYEQVGGTPAPYTADIRAGSEEIVWNGGAPAMPPSTLTTVFPTRATHAMQTPPPSVGDRRTIALTLTSGDALEAIQFDTDPAPVATLYNDSGGFAQTLTPPITDVCNNSTLTDFDTASAITIEARIPLDLRDVAPGAYVLVMASSCGTEEIQTSCLLDVR